ncbi:hypothetical protein DPMN_048161 [Dreissena polymorpha]|uniref:Uncharacterized protein n=1 Tax=Dreissena polymorpha TaxID=45954 RepID=A0A9D4D922_DREPO|nr:hypothetical protein DPMN_048161 [Dreissena polymorpha]
MVEDMPNKLCLSIQTDFRSQFRLQRVAYSTMMEQYIKFPESRHELKIIADGFHQRWAVDGTHSACPISTSDDVQAGYYKDLALRQISTTEIVLAGSDSNVHK